MNNPAIYINPPSTNASCDCCGRHISEIGDHVLQKDYRGDGGCVSAYWVCKSCAWLTDETFWKLYNNHDGFGQWLKNSDDKNLDEWFGLLDD